MVWYCLIIRVPNQNPSRNRKSRTIPKTIGVALWRCATLRLEGGADNRFIQQLLGHEKLVTTQIYAQVSIRMLKEVHISPHPARLTLDAQTAELEAELTEEEAELAEAENPE